MRVDTISLYVLLEVVLISIPTIVSGAQQCQPRVDMTDRDYTYVNNAYFRYCPEMGKLKRKGRSQHTCHSGGKLKLYNFHAFVPTRSRVTCTDVVNTLRYKKKLNTECLPRSQRDDIALPFLKALSGKTTEELKRYGSADDIPMVSSGGDYKQITLEVGCETESRPKLDMCTPISGEVYRGLFNVSLKFFPKTFDPAVHQGNQSGCYCYFKTFNTSRPIIMRALDIQLDRRNRLTLNSALLPSDQLYWWQTGVLSEGLSVLTLTGLGLNHLPDMVWMDLYGENMNITCDTKPIIVEGVVTNRPQKFASSSSGGLNIIYIIIIVVACIVLFIVVISVVKVFQTRMSTASKSGAYKVDDPYASETFISSTYEKGDDAPSPRDSVVVYSKDDNQTAVYSQSRKKSRKGGESDEARLYEFDSDTDQDDAPGGEVDTGIKIAHNAMVHDRPHDTPKTPTADDSSINIYNHFPDHPDVVPSTNSNNIYSTTGTGVYASLNTHRQLSKPVDNTYDVA